VFLTVGDIGLVDLLLAYYTLQVIEMIDDSAFGPIDGSGGAETFVNLRFNAAITP